MKRIVLALWVLLAAAGSGAAQTAVSTGDDVLVVPGAPDDYWKAASLTGVAPVGPRFLLEFIRAVEAMEIHDTGRLRSVYEYLGTAPATRGQGTRSFTIPLPLRASVWTKLSSNGGADPFGTAIRDRRTRRLLYGAASLNPSTRVYFEGRSALVERIHRSYSDVFAVLGRSISIRNGRVDVPGGPAAVALWEQLVGASTGDPDTFIDRLLARDTGELASLYDSVAHLDAPHQRFVLGVWMPEALRRTRFVTLYRAARAASRRVAIAHQPFVRTEPDLFVLVSQLRVLEDGRPAAPVSPAFWRAVFEKTERWPDTEWSGFADETSIDATWFVEVVMLSVRPIREQAALVSFAQRVFATIAAPAGPGRPAPAVSVLREFGRFPALAVALERIGISDASVYSAAFNRAGTLNAGGNAYWRRQLLLQFQGALAIVEQLHRTNRVSTAVAEQLISSLSRIQPNPDSTYGGGVARWIAEQLLPALGANAGTDSDVELRLLTALSGTPENEASAAKLTWEDWEYRIDSSSVPLPQLRKIRAQQAGNSLDTVLRLWQTAARLGALRTGRASGLTDADALGQVAEVANSLRALLGGIREPNLPSDQSRNDAPNVAVALREVAAALAEVRQPGHLSRVPEVATRLMKVVDVMTADVLASLVYAVHIGDPDDPLWLAGGVAHRHDFGLLNRDSLDPALLSWSLPAEQLGGTWHIRGSLLGFDIGLARLRLPRVATAGPPAQPVMASEDLRVFVEAMAMFDPSSAGDEVMHAIAQAIRVGRDRVTAAATDRQNLDRLAAIGHLSEWRRHSILPWLVTNRPGEVVQLFSLTELYWIGLSSGISVPSGADSWGASSFSVGGCQCLRMPAPQAWEDLSGRLGAVPTGMADVTLRLAELMTDLKLPAVLARHLLPTLMRDFLDRVQMVHSDDWSAVVRYWVTVQRDRINEVMGQLTVNGPLLAGGTDSRR